MKLYVIMCDALLAMKIGVADQPARRLAELQVGNPHVLRLAAVRNGGFWEEKQIHRELAPRRLHGEWFHATEDVVAHLHSIGMFDQQIERSLRGRRKSTRDILTSRDAAGVLAVSPRTLEKWRTRGFGPPYFKAGTKVCYERKDVDSWIIERTASSTAGSAGYKPGAR